MDVFVTSQTLTANHSLEQFFKQNKNIGNIFILAPQSNETSSSKRFEVDSIVSTSTIKTIAGSACSKYVLFICSYKKIEVFEFALERLIQTAENTNAHWLYTNFIEINNNVEQPRPTIEYQLGSIRDNFNFGEIILLNTDALKNAAGQMNEDYKYAGLYDLRLRMSENMLPFHLPETLYNTELIDTRKSGEKQFDYVDPKNRAVQIEMEHAAASYLKRINAFIDVSSLKDVNFADGNFPVEASVIIPVKNRKGTIKEAVVSALNQKTKFNYNIIVIDNHSTDGTGEILNSLSTEHEKVIHIIPETDSLGIGGCWNLGILNENCGKFAVQLDSDDLYKDETTLQQIVDKFYETNCAMVIGSYLMTDFNLKEIPPGLIDHSEWTDGNGMNNALRINGLGAPRAFYTKVIREILFPNVSYGEDYAAALAISRNYKIGRIFNPVYLCRRWEGNSDADLDIEKVNKHNFYKDKIRTIEILNRKKSV